MCYMHVYIQHYYKDISLDSLTRKKKEKEKEEDIPWSK